ncbi:hypothetical protein D9757_013791 [Collybiopsis confluens]|uniref:Uncharacterized protein n=1 Tax=Collybiopsis confluens TaxID=2823264 RepID=A0A8H5FQE9_9AGAR|nr:hypothetical protein D9757_013791 [Collybiopsis confluens]
MINYMGWMMVNAKLYYPPVCSSSPKLRIMTRSCVGSPQKLCESTTLTISYNYIDILATYSDRAPASLGTIPSPFFIVLSEVVSFESPENGIGPARVMPFTESDFQESRAIRARGGCGRALFVFNFIEDFFSEPMNLRTICRPHRIDLTDRPVSGRTHSLGWQDSHRDVHFHCFHYSHTCCSGCQRVSSGVLCLLPPPARGEKPTPPAGTSVPPSPHARGEKPDPPAGSPVPLPHARGEKLVPPPVRSPVP